MNMYEFEEKRENQRIRNWLNWVTEPKNSLLFPPFPISFLEGMTLERLTWLGYKRKNEKKKGEREDEKEREEMMEKTKNKEGEGKTKDWLMMPSLYRVALERKVGKERTTKERMELLLEGLQAIRLKWSERSRFNRFSLYQV